MGNPTTHADREPTVKPTGDLLIIRRINPPKPVTSWGFELPATEDHEASPYHGVVLFAGPGKRAKLAPAASYLVKALENLVKTHTDPSHHRELWDNARRALTQHHALPERVVMQVRVGDIVVFSRHGYQAFRAFDEDLIVLQEASVIAVLELGASLG